jgi:hypothetical protein
LIMFDHRENQNPGYPRLVDMLREHLGAKNVRYHDMPIGSTTLNRGVGRACGPGRFTAWAGQEGQDRQPV